MRANSAGSTFRSMNGPEDGLHLHENLVAVNGIQISSDIVDMLVKKCVDQTRLKELMQMMPAYIARYGND